jgi:cytochrome oxidase Cu insertion factor (SCO1/SenC/PrrC family)
VLRTWLSHFDKRIIGLTGDEKAIRTAQLAANVAIANSAPSYEPSAFALAYTKNNLANVISSLWN